MIFIAARTKSRPLTSSKASGVPRKKERPVVFQGRAWALGRVGLSREAQEATFFWAASWPGMEAGEPSARVSGSVIPALGQTVGGWAR